MTRPSLLARWRGVARPGPAPHSAAPLLDVEGVCPVCDRQTRFQSWSEWLRDGLICVRCHSLPRERAFYTVLERVRPDWRGVAIHESSPSDGESKLRRECPGYVPTHFNPDLPRGAEGPDWRNEDLEDQTFADESFDVVVTQDVFEHLLDPGRAIREIARTLKPGGLHIATVPLVRRDGVSTRRARRDADGEVEHLQEAAHHRNPIDPEGSLVTIDWGYDIADFFDREAGLNTTIWSLDDLSRGIRAELIEVLVSRKAAPPAL
jgi:Zn ribbon nucleic-acid-binding protein